MPGKLGFNSILYFYTTEVEFIAFEDFCKDNTQGTHYLPWFNACKASPLGCRIVEGFRVLV